MVDSVAPPNVNCPQGSIDSSKPDYSRQGTGWKCKIERTRTTALACKTSSSKHGR